MSVSKLVRDRIPEILLADDAKFTMCVLSRDEYKDHLDAKLSEEVSEFKQDHSLEELADVLEVVYAIAKAHGYTLDDLEQVRADKEQLKGSFSKQYFVRIE